PKHNGAAFMPYRGSQQGSVRGTSMRLIVGIIIGCALTVGGAYVADTMAAAGAKPVMVNWEIVAKNMDSVTALARAGWKKVAGRPDGRLVRGQPKGGARPPFVPDRRSLRTRSGPHFLPLEDDMSDDKEQDRAGHQADDLRPHDQHALQ